MNIPFFGKGLSYPMRLDTTGTRPVIAEQEDLIRQSMDQIINTDITERPFLVRNGVPFGTRCRRIIFENVDVATDIIRYECKRALDVWEPRIIVDSVATQEVTLSDGASAILADISFRYRSTNRSDNFVVPFRFTRPQ